MSLGIGVVQLNYGLSFLFGVPEGLAAQIGLVALAVLMATVSAVTGVDRGIRRLSQLNVILAIVLMLYVTRGTVESLCPGRALRNASGDRCRDVRVLGTTVWPGHLRRPERLL